jgi:hypothetical protein
MQGAMEEHVLAEPLLQIGTVLQTSEQVNIQLEHRKAVAL